MQSFHHYHLRHRKDQRIDNNLTDTINYRHSSLDAAYYYQAQLLATSRQWWRPTVPMLPQGLDVQVLPSQILTYPPLSHTFSWWSSPWNYSLSLYWIWISSRLEANTLFGLGWNLLDGPFIGKRRRTRSQFELVQPTCHVLQGQHTHLCYSLVVGLAPLGPSLGWKDLFSLTRVAWGSV